MGRHLVGWADRIGLGEIRLASMPRHRPAAFVPARPPPAVRLAPASPGSTHLCDHRAAHSARPGDRPVDRFEPNLRIPGPTSLPPSVRQAGARQMINHRGPEFAAMLERILSGMKPFFGTTSDVAMITTAGSRPRSSTRFRRAIASWASRSARSATGSPRSPGCTGPKSRRSTSSGDRPRIRRPSGRPWRRPRATRRCSSPTTRPRPGS